MDNINRERESESENKCNNCINFYDDNDNTQLNKIKYEIIKKIEEYESKLIKKHNKI
jgi:hypothetical protein